MDYRSQNCVLSGLLCRVLFRELDVLTLTSQYVLSLMRFRSSNLGNYKFNTSIHDKNPRHKLKLHKPSTRLSMYQKSVYYNGINVYNTLPDAIAELVANKKFFSRQLKKYLIDKSFYSLEEFMDSWQTHDGRSTCELLTNIEVNCFYNLSCI